jgi:hypothetical protein
VKTPFASHDNFHDTQEFQRVTNRASCCGLTSAPGGARTPNLLIRSQMLYPIALRARTGVKVTTRPSPFHACPDAACSDKGTHQPAETRE